MLSRFENLGQQLRAIYIADTNGQPDARLQHRATGMNEDVGSMGGHALDTEFVERILSRTYDLGQFIGRAMKIPITQRNATGLRLSLFAEASRATGSRLGGLRMTWLKEGGVIPASKPTLRSVDMRLAKLAGLIYMTDDLFSDVPALEKILEEAFAEETAFAVEYSAFTGNGAGELLGVLNSPSLIAVAKQGGQSAATIVAQNIIDMFGRMWGPSRHRACWFVNMEAEPLLIPLVNVASGDRLYEPAKVPGEYAMMLGSPVIPVEYCSAPGTVGDIVYADPSQYLITDKGGPQFTPSIHVAFLTAENAFRFIYRVQGQSSWSAPVTPMNGANTLSPFVALEARA
jgi:HK97 family phage major capsid protein